MVACGVCGQAESKYKCPSCHLRYCSIACFKLHKETHLNDVNEPPALQPSRPVDTPPAPIAAPPSRPKKPSFSNFESDPDLLNLLARYPNLRIQLQSVYGLTLEPPNVEQPTYSRRGRGGRSMAQHSHSQWTQAKGDKEAMESFRNMRRAEGDDRGIAEFVHLVQMRFAEGEGEGT